MVMKVMKNVSWADEVDGVEPLGFWMETQCAQNSLQKGGTERRIRQRRQRRPRNTCASQGQCKAAPQPEGSNASMPNDSEVQQQALGNPQDLSGNSDDCQFYCNELIHQLDQGNREQQHEMLLWLQPALLSLALSKYGTRIVQKALEVAGGADRDMIICELQDHIGALYESPNGNHVLSRAVEVLPVTKISFVILALCGRCTTVSRHKFGCRVVCRLIEHCSEEQIRELLDEVLPEADTLARHQYGNFVVRSMLEHTSPALRSAVLARILPVFAALAIHRVGSLVTEAVFSHCDFEGQQAAIYALRLQGSVVEIACNHYGSFVLAQVAAMQAHSNSVSQLAHILANNLPELQASEYAQRVLLAFGFAPANAPISIAS